MSNFSTTCPNQTVGMPPKVETFITPLSTAIAVAKAPLPLSHTGPWSVAVAASLGTMLRGKAGLPRLAGRLPAP